MELYTEVTFITMAKARYGIIFWQAKKKNKMKWYCVLQIEWCFNRSNKSLLMNLDYQLILFVCSSERLRTEEGKNKSTLIISRLICRNFCEKLLEMYRRYWLYRCHHTICWRQFSFCQWLHPRLCQWISASCQCAPRGPWNTF